jgi:hypothetical protein
MDSRAPAFPILVRLIQRTLQQPSVTRIVARFPCLLSRANSQESVSLSTDPIWHLECRRFEAISLAFCEYRAGRRFVGARNGRHLKPYHVTWRWSSSKYDTRGKWRPTKPRSQACGVQIAARFLILKIHSELDYAGAEILDRSTISGKRKGASAEKRIDCRSACMIEEVKDLRD